MIDLFIKQEELKFMSLQSRIDKIIITKDLNKSINFYRDLIGLQMRPICNPVAMSNMNIFRYLYI